MIRRTFHALSALTAFFGTIAAALYRDRAAHAEERSDDMSDLLADAIREKQEAWTETGLQRDRAERAERELAQSTSRLAAAEQARDAAELIAEDEAADAVRRVRGASMALSDQFFTLESCYEIGWRAIVERHYARGVAREWQSKCIERAQELGAANNRIVAHRKLAEDNYESWASVSADLTAARARIAELEQAACIRYVESLGGRPDNSFCVGCYRSAPCGSCPDGLPRCDDCYPGQASAPVEPAAVDAVAAYECDACGEDTAHKNRVHLNKTPYDICNDCLKAVDSDIRAAQTVAAAVEPCASCDPGPQPEEDKDDEERASVIDSFLTDLGDMLESHLPDAAPTQDDLDDAAVRELLARGPATRVGISACLSHVHGSDRWSRSRRAIIRVGPDAIGDGLYSMQVAIEAGK